MKGRQLGPSWRPLSKFTVTIYLNQGTNQQPPGVFYLDYPLLLLNSDSAAKT